MSQDCFPQLRKPLGREIRPSNEWVEVGNIGVVSQSVSQSVSQLLSRNKNGMKGSNLIREKSSMIRRRNPVFAALILIAFVALIFLQSQQEEDYSNIISQHHQNEAKGKS